MKWNESVWRRNSNKLVIREVSDMLRHTGDFRKTAMVMNLCAVEAGSGGTTNWPLMPIGMGKRTYGG